MIDLVDINIRAAIAFGLAMTVALLTYIAFFKKSSIKYSYLINEKSPFKIIGSIDCNSSKIYDWRGIGFRKYIFFFR